MGSSLYSSSKAYKRLIGSIPVHPCYSWPWKSAVQHKHKTFFWLLIKDRLSTRGLLKRKNMELPSYNCVLCMPNTEESMEHIFLQCPFAQQCWNLLHLHITDPNDLFSSLERMKIRLQLPFLHGYCYSFVLVYMDGKKCSNVPWNSVYITTLQGVV